MDLGGQSRSHILKFESRNMFNDIKCCKVFKNGSIVHKKTFKRCAYGTWLVYIYIKY